MQSQAVKRKRTSEDEPSTFQRRMGNTMVNIYVGEGDDSQHFVAHEKVLCDRVPYFKMMFAGDFKEAKTNVAHFPKDDPEVFDILLSWVYDGSLRKLTAVHIHDISEEPSNAMIRGSWDTFALYFLAEKICLPELMDAVMDVQRRFDTENDELPSLALVRSGYENTFHMSTIRKYLAYTCAYSIVTAGCDYSDDTQDLSDLMVEIPDLNLDILRILGKLGGVLEDPSDLPCCYFHTHDKGLPCPWKKAASDDVSLMGEESASARKSPSSPDSSLFHP